MPRFDDIGTESTLQNPPVASALSKCALPRFSPLASFQVEVE